MNINDKLITKASKKSEPGLVRNERARTGQKRTRKEEVRNERWVGDDAMRLLAEAHAQPLALSVHKHLGLVIGPGLDLHDAHRVGVK